MKSKKLIATLAVALAVTAPVLAGCNAKKPGGNGNQSLNSSVEAMKYFVNYQTSADYSIAGISAEGYEAGETVSFTVTVTDAENKEISAVKMGDTNIEKGADGKYSFVMPERNVQVVVSLKNILKYVMTYDGTPKVDEEITVNLSLGTDPVADDFVVEGKTADDKAKMVVRDGNKVKFTAEGDVTMVAKINNEVKAELKVTVAKSDMVSIKEALDAAIKEAPCNGKAGNNSAKTTSDFTIGGKIVSISDKEAETSANVNITAIIDDGTELVPLIVYGTRSNWKVALGDSVKVTCKFTNYYGILEAIGTTSTATSQKSLFPDSVVKINNTYTTSTAKAMTAAELDAYYNTCKTNGTNGATAYTSIKPAMFSGINKQIEDKIRLVYSGGAAENAGAVALVGTASCPADETVGRGLTVKGYLLGGNTSSKNLTFHMLEKQTVNATAVTIIEKGTDLTVALNNTLQLSYALTPSEATANSVEWTSSDTSKATVDANGLVKGVAEGETTITVKVDGKLTDSVKVTVSGALNHATSITLDKTSEELVRGATLQLTANLTAEDTTKPCTDKVEWTSSDATKATVSETGLVTAVANGEVTITASANGKSASCKVTVRDQKLADLGHAVVGDKVDTYAYYQGDYENGTKNGYWLADGTSGVFIYAAPSSITGKEGGVAKGDIVHLVGTVAANHGGKQVAATSAEVVASHEGLTTPTALNITSDTVLDETNQGAYATVTGTVKSVSISSSNHITATIDLGNAKTLKVYQHASNNSTANVNDFKAKVTQGKVVTIGGFVTANKTDVTDFTTLAAGDYQLINNRVLSVQAPTVQDIELASTASVKPGQTVQLSASLLPAGAEADGSIAWSVTGNEKITVDNNGLVSAAADAVVGSTAIVTATYGSISKSCTVTVIAADAAEAVTVTKTATEIVAENSYTISAGTSVTCYTSLSLDEVLTVSTTGTANCGSFWGTTSQDWRLYQNKNGNINVSVASGYKILSLKLTFTVSNTGVLKANDVVIDSDTTVEVNASSWSAIVANSGTATNGQVRITSFQVTYIAE